MAKIGKMNVLEILREKDFGVFLDGGALGDILLPRKDVPKEARPGDSVEVFIYTDSEDRLIATMKRPYAMAGEFAFLRVAAINKVGIFLDWGLQKDLLLPFSEQKKRLQEGKYYVVYVYLDTMTGRVVASSKIDDFLKQDVCGFNEGQKVRMFIVSKTDLGYSAIINDKYKGLIFESDVIGDVKIGDQVMGYIKKVRDDGKIDLCMKLEGYKNVSALTEQILKQIDDLGGCLPLNDKSSPEEIFKVFGVSKKVFKQSLGALYKKRLVVIGEDGVRLSKK